MILIRNLNQINQQLPKTALTIGNFDGVHIAHQSIIYKTQEIAQKNKLKSAILTFEPHPVAFINSQNENFNHAFRINNLALKLKIIKNYNLDYVIIIPFNQKFSSIKANDFIKNILIDKFNVNSLIIGYDFTFGKNREGNIEDLQKYNFDIHQVKAHSMLDKNNQPLVISSSLARKYIKSGDVDFLSQILGTNFAIEGLVIHGLKLAGNIGFKTANLKAKPHLIQPKFGVYKTRTFVYKYNRFFDSITNFGVKPTIDNTNTQPIFETHLFNFADNLYQQKIRIEFLKFIRDEKKFLSITDLKNQIKHDIDFCLKNTN